MNDAEDGNDWLADAFYEKLSWPRSLPLPLSSDRGSAHPTLDNEGKL